MYYFRENSKYIQFNCQIIQYYKFLMEHINDDGYPILAQKIYREIVTS